MKILSLFLGLYVMANDVTEQKSQHVNPVLTQLQTDASDDRISTMAGQ